MKNILHNRLKTPIDKKEWELFKRWQKMEYQCLYNMFKKSITRPSVFPTSWFDFKILISDPYFLSNHFILRFNGEKHKKQKQIPLNNIACVWLRGGGLFLKESGGKSQIIVNI